MTSFNPQSTPFVSIPMKHIVLADWKEFEESLRANLYAIGHTGLVIAGNLATRSMTPDLVETNQLELVLGTGTNRSADNRTLQTGTI